MQIRHAKREDIPQMVELLVDLFAMEPDFPIDRAKHAQGLHFLFDQPSCLALVAVGPGGASVSGMITLQPHISSGFGCIDGVLEDFVVKAALRGQGIGRRLMAEIETEAIVLGYGRLRLYAERSNERALHFYQNSGWKPGSMTSFYRSLLQ